MNTKKLAIMKTDKLFKDLKWIIQARSDDETRPMMNGFCIDNDYIVSTDGRRLHLIAITSDIRQGLTDLGLDNNHYTVLEETSKSIIITDNDTAFAPYEKIINPPFDKCVKINEVNYSVIIATIYQLTGRHLSIIYLNEVFNPSGSRCMPNDVYLYWSFCNTHTSIKIVYGDKIAFIAVIKDVKQYASKIMEI